MVDFKESVTRTNLMRAFAGESQARNRYTIAAGKAREMNLPVLHDVFLYTADQEKEHAKIFYNYLKQMTGEKITITGDYPIDNYDDVGRLLRAAQHGENDEHDVVYKEFAEVAKREGFTQIAATFEMIAKIEKVHAERFGKFADLLERNELFKSDSETTWMCQNCGHIHVGTEVPGKCPVCDAVQGQFLRYEMTPFSACVKE